MLADRLRPPEYDSSTGVRGEYYKAYREGHTVNVHKDDETTVVQYSTLEDGTVMLEPDVRECFPDAEAVSVAIRSLIALMPQRREKG